MFWSSTIWGVCADFIHFYRFSICVLCLILGVFNTLSVCIHVCVKRTVQNHRIIGGWKGPLEVSIPSSLLEQAHFQQVVQDSVQAGFDHLKRLHSLSGQPNCLILPSAKILFWAVSSAHMSGNVEILNCWSRFARNQNLFFWQEFFCKLLIK